MTKENSKRLYDHYVSINKTAAIEDMLNKYPEFAEEDKKQKSKNSKD